MQLPLTTVELNTKLAYQNVSKERTVNIAQAANTYDITTATGDVMIERFYVYVATAGATMTSVSIQTNDTTPFYLLSAVEGAVANIVAGSNINPANKNYSFKLTSGKKLQFTIVGATGTGELRLVAVYRPCVSGTLVTLS